MSRMGLAGPSVISATSVSEAGRRDRLLGTAHVNTRRNICSFAVCFLFLCCFWHFILKVNLQSFDFLNIKSSIIIKMQACVLDVDRKSAVITHQIKCCIIHENNGCLHCPHLSFMKVKHFI